MCPYEKGAQINVGLFAQTITCIFFQFANDYDIVGKDSKDTIIDEVNSGKNIPYSDPTGRKSSTKLNIIIIIVSYRNIRS